MIDEITFCGPAPDDLGAGEIPAGFTPKPRKPGRLPQWARSIEHGAVWIGCEPDTRIIEVRLSVPRWLNRQKLVNYPIPQILTVSDLKLPLLARTIASALGVRISAVGDDWVSALPLHRWAVVHVSYTADLPSSDPGVVLGGLQGIRRSHGAKVNAVGNVTESLRWKASGVTTRFYDKGAEIRSHWRKHPEHRELLDTLAMHASRRIRFEVAVTGAKAIRTLLRKVLRFPRTSLPTLSFMCRPEVAAFAWRREVDRLGLWVHHTPTSAETFGGRARRVGLSVDALRKSVTKQNQFRKRQSMTKARVRDLIVAHFLLSGMRTKEVANIVGWSEGKVFDLLADLKEGGLLPDSSPSGGLAEAANAIVNALAPYLLAPERVAPAAMADLARSIPGAFTFPPWVDGVTAAVEEDDVDGEDDPEDDVLEPAVGASTWEDVVEWDIKEQPGDEGGALFPDPADDHDVDLTDYDFDPSRGEVVRLT
jgi:hypothetical protein